MLHRLAEDQAYRARWHAERGQTRARWQRAVSFTLASLAAVAVVAASVIEIAGFLH